MCGPLYVSKICRSLRLLCRIRLVGAEANWGLVWVLPTRRPWAANPSPLACCRLTPEITLSSWHFIDLWLFLDIYSPLWNFAATKKTFISVHEANFDTFELENKLS